MAGCGGRGRVCGGQEAGAGLDPGPGPPLRGPVLPRPWALDPLARPSGCPQPPGPPAADPPPHPSRRPRDLGPPQPPPLLSTGPGLRSGRKGIHSLPSPRPAPLGPLGPAPGLRCPGREMAHRPGLPEPRAPGSTLRLPGTAKATARLSRSARPGAPHTGPREAPAPRLTPHRRTRPEEETLAGPQARRGAGQEWERNGTADTKAGPKQAGPPSRGRWQATAASWVCGVLSECVCVCVCVSVRESGCVSVACTRVSYRVPVRMRVRVTASGLGAGVGGGGSEGGLRVGESISGALRSCRLCRGPSVCVCPCVSLGIRVSV